MRGRLNLFTAFPGVVMPRGRYSAAKASPRLKATAQKGSYAEGLLPLRFDGGDGYGRPLEDTDVGHLASVKVFRYASLFRFLEIGLVVALVGRCLLF